MLLSIRDLRLGLFFGVLALAGALRADTVDDAVKAQMEKRHIPGLSLAVVKNGEVVRVGAYGLIEQGKSARITVDTLFQAGSVSKPVAALGALHLVEAGRLSLDADVNRWLKGWVVPQNDLTRKSPVTLRRLLSHSAGMTVHGFPGYAADEPLPTLVQVLDGAKPANTQSIRVDIEPGSKLRYSGGGYTVVQQLMIDASEKAFPDYMQNAVLRPLGMQASTFDQPLPAGLAALAATGHYPGNPAKPVPGRWHVYPEMAAAGLWTTPSDLARFMLAVQSSYDGHKTPVVSSAMTHEQLSAQSENAGLGLFLSGQGKSRRFEHNGRDEGFDTALTAYVETGDGAVIMINSNDDSGAISRIMESIADTYDWIDFPHKKRPLPIEDKEPKVTAEVRQIMEQAKSGILDETLFTAKVLAEIKPMVGEVKETLRSLGPLKSVALIGRDEQGDFQQYHYLLIYETDAISVHCGFNKEKQVAWIYYLFE